MLQKKGFLSGTQLVFTASSTQTNLPLFVLRLPMVIKKNKVNYFTNLFKVLFRVKSISFF